MAIIQVINFSDPQAKSLFVQHVRTLEGDHRVEVVRARMTASQKQHAYYRGLVLAMMGDEFRAQGNEVTDDEVHQRMARKYLRVTRFNKNTGEVWGEVVRSAGDLNTEEMAEFIEKVRGWAAERMGLDIPDPDPMWRVGKDGKSPRSRGHAGSAA